MFTPLFNTRFAYDLYGPELTGRVAVPIDWDLTYVWGLWLLLLVVLMTPLVIFLGRGWWHRRSDILSNFSDEAAAFYLLFFRSADTDKDSKKVCGGLRDCRDTWARSRQVEEERGAEARNCRKEAAEKRAANDTTGADASEDKAKGLDAEAAKAREDQAAASKLWKMKAMDAMRVFVAYYDDQFGRRRFAWPGVLLAVMTGALLLFPATAALTELRAQAQSGASSALAGVWVWAVAVAVLGGYTRVVFELTGRTQQVNVRPSDLLWGCFRVLISVPLGYAIGKSLGGDSGHLTLAVAFLLGLFPTTTIMTVGRRIFYTTVLKKEEEAPSKPLLALLSLDQQTAEQLNEEGITNITQLAYTDPVRLSIRTGLGFGYLVSCQSEALLADYLTDRRRMEVMRLFGVCGAYEAASLYNDLTSEPAGPRADVAKTLVKQMADRLGAIKLPAPDGPPDKPMTQEGLVNVLSEVAGDPYTWFIRETWAATVPV